MSDTTANYSNFQDFLDEVQYSKQGVRRYEWIFGEGYLSTGGADTTKEIVPLLNLQSGQRILDVGCGLGGHDFYMAEKYNVTIDAIDLSKNMMTVALDHFRKKPHLANLINFKISDVTTTDYPNNYYDVIYSRDALLHIEDKEKLFQQFFKWLKPGGKVCFTDYCRGDKPQYSEEFVQYLANRSYHLFTINQYNRLLNTVGFVNIKTDEIADKFIVSLEKELKKLYDEKEDFLQQCSKADYTDLEEGWLAKLTRIKNGDQTWVLCYAEKPVN